MSSTEYTCENPDCRKKATLQCPTCLKIGIQGSYFCGQDCFKDNWKAHKIIHLLASELNLFNIFKFCFAFIRFRADGQTISILIE